MAITPGQRFVRRQDAARSSTVNNSAADITYDTAVISEGGYSYSSPEVTVDEAGLYLTIFDIGQVDLPSTRAVGTLVPAINGTQQNRFRASHRYLRNSGGAQEGASIGMAFLNLSTSDAVKVRNPGALAPTDAIGNYATNASMGGALQLIRFPSGNFTHVERTVDAAEVGQSNINATRPWIDTSGTWTTITFDNEVRDDDNLYSGTGGDITLAANKKYAIVWGATCYSTDSSRHCYVARLQIANVNVQTASGYQRTTASQGPPMCGLYLHETGGSAETLRIQATHETEGGDAGVPNVSDAYVQIVELPTSAEWIHVDNGTNDSLDTALTNLTTWYDTPLSSTLRADGDSELSLDTANDAVQNDSGSALPVLAIGWHRWDRDATNGNRKSPWTRWENNGSAIGYGVAGAFNRGSQGTDDTWQSHYCSAATFDLSNGGDLKFQVNDEASTVQGNMGVYASANRHFLGVQVLKLSSLDAGGGEDALLADDVETNSEVTIPTLGQTHGLLSTDVESSSEVTTPAISQAHVLLADNIESSSEVSAPALSETHLLNATDTESTSELTVPVIEQEHVLTADDVSSNTEVSIPALSQEHDLLVVSTESASEVTNPTLSESHIFDATDTETTTEVTVPSIGQGHTLTVGSADSTSEVSAPVIAQIEALLADNVESSSEASSPSITQVELLLADDVETTSEITLPELGQSYALLAEDSESASEVTNPALTQQHDILADDVQSSSELNSPSLTQSESLLAENTQSLSEITSPSLGQEHALLVTSTESTSEVSEPILTSAAGVTSLLAEDVESSTGVGTPSLGQEHQLDSVSNIESSSEVTGPTLGQGHTLLSDSSESTSEVTTPDIGQVHVLTYTVLESISEVTSPSLSQAQGILADDVESATETSTPSLTQIHDFLAVSIETASEVTAPSITQTHPLLAQSIESTTEITNPVLNKPVVAESGMFRSMWTDAWN